MKKIILFFVSVFLPIVFLGCGSGCSGGTSCGEEQGSTLSGTVATGAVFKGTVIVKGSDDNTTDPVAIHPETGFYTVDVSNLNPPYILKAMSDGSEGAKSPLYSLATTTGTTNITTLTTEITEDALQAALEKSTAVVFNNPVHLVAVKYTLMGYIEKSEIELKIELVQSAIENFGQGILDTLDFMSGPMMIGSGIDQLMDDERGTPRHIAQATVAATNNLASSLHGTGKGMRFWFEQNEGLHKRGIGSIIDLTYEQLRCSASCHTTSTGASAPGAVVDADTCSLCHNDETYTKDTKAKDPATCTANCHGRQSVGTMVGFDAVDVHTKAGKGCGDCHTFGEIHGHGDGVEYSSLHQNGQMERDCESCHTSASDYPVSSTVPEHTKHTKDIHCDSCHMQSVVTCYNCHLDSSETVFQAKGEPTRVFAGPQVGFIILANDEVSGKIKPASYQSVVSGDQTFVAFAPMHTHSIQKNGRTCSDCHDNANMKALTANNRIGMVSLSGTGVVSHTQGVIPFVPNKLEFTYLDHTLPDPPASYDMLGGVVGTWTSKTNESKLTQYNFITPLTDKQIEALSSAQPSE